MHGPGNVGRTTFVRTAGHGWTLASQGPLRHGCRIPAPRLPISRPVAGVRRMSRRRTVAHVPHSVEAPQPCVRRGPVAPSRHSSAARAPARVARARVHRTVAADRKVHDPPGSAAGAPRGPNQAGRSRKRAEPRSPPEDYVEHPWGANVPDPTQAAASRTRLTPASPCAQRELWRRCTRCRPVVSKLRVCGPARVRAELSAATLLPLGASHAAAVPRMPRRARFCSPYVTMIRPPRGGDLPVVRLRPDPVVRRSCPPAPAAAGGVGPP